MELVDFAEQRLIGTIIVKDHSRLGRNRLIFGQLLEEDFVRWGVRYISTSLCEGDEVRLLCLPCVAP